MSIFRTKKQKKKQERTAYRIFVHVTDHLKLPLRGNKRAKTIDHLIGKHTSAFLGVYTLEDTKMIIDDIIQKVREKYDITDRVMGEDRIEHKLRKHFYSYFECLKHFEGFEHSDCYYGAEVFMRRQCSIFNFHDGWIFLEIENTKYYHDFFYIDEEWENDQEPKQKK